MDWRGPVAKKLHSGGCEAEARGECSGGAAARSTGGGVVARKTKEKRNGQRGAEVEKC